MLFRSFSKNIIHYITYFDKCIIFEEHIKLTKMVS